MMLRNYAWKLVEPMHNHGIGDLGRLIRERAIDVIGIEKDHGVGALAEKLSGVVGFYRLQTQDE